MTRVQGVRMKPVLAILCLLLSTPVWAGPWIVFAPVALGAANGNATIEVDEKVGKIDNIRFQLDGATVEFTSFTAVPVKGDPISLRVPGTLKSGEGSGLINIPGQAVVLDSLKLGYRIVSGSMGTVTVRVKTD